MTIDQFDIEEPPTARICVVCDGNLLVERRRDDTTYEGLMCKWCDATGIMTNAQYFHWQLMHERSKDR